MKKLIMSLFFVASLAHGMYCPPQSNFAYVRLFHVYRDGYVAWLQQNKRIHSSVSLFCFITTQMDKELNQREKNINAYKQLLVACKSPKEVHQKGLNALIAGSCLIKEDSTKIDSMIKHLEELRPEVETQLLKSKL